MSRQAEPITREKMGYTWGTRDCSDRGGPDGDRTQEMVLEPEGPQDKGRHSGQRRAEDDAVARGGHVAAELQPRWTNPSHPEVAKILMVDDRPEDLAALEALLAPLGHGLVTAQSGEEALSQLLRHEFALILLDVQMPGMDGFETAAHIKQRAKTCHVPIIFVTAFDADSQEALRGYTVGAVDYISKPFHPTVLRSKVSVFLDLHRLRRDAEELAHRALHDALTELPNRVLLADRLELALARLRRRPTRLAVTFIDLDGFKQVNDRWGHEIGDRALKVVAERLRRVVRPSDTLARFGGDEFTVLSEDLADERGATDIADRLARAVGEPMPLGDGSDVRLRASIGIAFASGPDDSPESLIREADFAMYRAKRLGDVPWVVYDGPASPAAVERSHDD
jgi:diguanylate cyclase